MRFASVILVVGLSLLLGSTAQAVVVEDDYEVGSGPYTFQVAMITDPSNNHENLRAARDTINKLVDEYGEIQMVMVLGDVTSTADTTFEFPIAKRILDSLEVPYVPLIGPAGAAKRYGQPLHHEVLRPNVRAGVRLFGSREVPADQGFPALRRASVELRDRVADGFP